jgi:hypothetical protein
MEGRLPRPDSNCVQLRLGRMAIMVYIQNKDMRESVESSTVRRKTLALRSGVCILVVVSLPDLTKVIRLADSLLQKPIVHRPPILDPLLPTAP